MFRRTILAISLLFLAFSLLSAKSLILKSPSGCSVISVSDNSGSLEWSVTYNGEQVLDPGAIAVDLEGCAVSGKICGCGRRSIDNVQECLVPCKFRYIKDVCNEMTLTLKGGWQVVFRAYDNGVAYRVVVPAKASAVNSETAVFNFTEGSRAFWPFEKKKNFITHCEADFKDIPLSEVGDETIAYLPLSVCTPSGVRMVLTESDLFDYPNMFLESTGGTGLRAIFPKVTASYQISGDRDPVVVGQEDYIAGLDGRRSLPWRLITLGDDRSLLENTLSWQLSSPEDPSIDWSWLAPGKISWEWWAALNVYGVDFEAGVNTDTYKYYIDFASEYGLPYILLDEGWSAGTHDIINVKPGLDLQELIRYGKEKNVGIVLWVLWVPMTRDMENILDTYESWGVKGVKIDFMQAQDQKMVRFYEKFARECAKRHLLADYHGAFKPAGIQRKYPNAMTYEGVYGMEHDKCSRDISPEHDLQLPFTRMVAGPMDYTPGACFNATKEDFAIRWEHPMSQGTRAHQAAIFIAFESPLMMLCDSPSNYRREPEFTSFIASIPTVWEETVAIGAKAGDYLVLARRNGDKWYIAGLNDWTGRTLDVSLDFLPEGVEFDAEIFKDGVNADRWAQDWKLEKAVLSGKDSISLKMANGGGWAAILTPRK